MLVADEPTSMLDVSIRVGILNLIVDLKQRKQLAFLYVTHDLASARYVADYMLVMYAGQIVEQGPADSVLQSAAASVHAPAARVGSRPGRPTKHERIEIRKGRRFGRGRPTRGLPVRRSLSARDRRLHARSRRSSS